MEKERFEKIEGNLEKILNSNVELINFNDSVKTLRVANFQEKGKTYLVISPNNFLGKIGYKFDSLKSTKYKAQIGKLESPGEMLFILEPEKYVLICTSKKDWPKEITKYTKMKMEEYWYVVGANRAKNQ